MTDSSVLEDTLGRALRPLTRASRQNACSFCTCHGLAVKYARLPGLWRVRDDIARICHSWSRKTNSTVATSAPCSSPDMSRWSLVRRAAVACPWTTCTSRRSSSARSARYCSSGSAGTLPGPSWRGRRPPMPIRRGARLEITRSVGRAVGGGRSRASGTRGTGSVPHIVSPKAEHSKRRRHPRSSFSLDLEGGLCQTNVAECQDGDSENL